MTSSDAARTLTGKVALVTGVARGMMARRQGRIVTIGSVAAFKGRTNASIYAVAKAGVTHYTRCLADQMRPYDIMVNCIAPGDTRTWGRARSIKIGWSKPARLTVSPPLTRWRGWSRSLLARSVRSSPGKCCGWMAAGNAGLHERAVEVHFGFINGHGVMFPVAHLKVPKRPENTSFSLKFWTSKGCRAGPPALPMAHEIP
jgi:hypothetical protein